MIQIPKRLSDLKIAPKGWEWIGPQRDLVEKAANSEAPVIIFQAEPGFGKTLWAVGLITALETTGVILVHNISLERQYLRDFKSLRMMQGRSHFVCPITGGSADKAPCTIGTRCNRAGQRDISTGLYSTWPTCDYFEKKAVASLVPISIHNYAYWLREIQASRIFGRKGVVVCDEAHGLEQVLMDSETIKLEASELRRFGVVLPNLGLDIANWSSWAGDLYDDVRTRGQQLTNKAAALGLSPSSDGMPWDTPEDYEEASLDTQDDLGNLSQSVLASQVVRDIQSIREIQTALELITKVDEDTWIVEPSRREAVFKPIFGAPGFKRLRAEASKKTVLMSAYLAPKLLMRTLGLREDECEVIEAPQIYDRRRSKIYYCPVEKLGQKTTEAGWNKTLGAMDRFIKHFGNRKGYIHVPSKSLRDRVLEKSLFRNVMAVYDAQGGNFGTKDEAIFRFSTLESKRILLGQSIATGLDIPYIPTWQIILKVAFPTLVDRQIQERMKRDKFFYPYLVVCSLVQTAGRIKRAHDHDGDTVILDGQFGWVFMRYKEHFPAWFKQALVYKGWERFREIQDA